MKLTQPLVTWVAMFLVYWQCRFSSSSFSKATSRLMDHAGNECLLITSNIPLTNSSKWLFLPLHCSYLEVLILLQMILAVGFCDVLMPAMRVCITVSIRLICSYPFLEEFTYVLMPARRSLFKGIYLCSDACYVRLCSFYSHYLTSLCFFALFCDYRFSLSSNLYRRTNSPSFAEVSADLCFSFLCSVCLPLFRDIESLLSL